MVFFISRWGSLLIMKRISQQFLLSFFLVSTLSLSFPAYSEKMVFSVGIVPQFEVRRLHAIWRPILNHLEKETGHIFKLKGSPTIPDFENEFLRGEFDFSYMNPYHIVLANKDQGYIPIVRDIGRKLFGVLVVKKGSNIQHVSQLKDKIIAFPAPNALGASLQMRQEIYDQFHIKILPTYVKTHDSVYLNVLLGKAVAGGGVQKTLNKQSDEYQNELKIIHKTTPVSPHPFSVHPRISSQLIKKVKSILLSLGKTDKGAALLAKIPIKKVGEASMEDYLPLQKMGLERFFVSSN
jgi:phosphonate transport system substrate-binding protein